MATQLQVAPALTRDQIAALLPKPVAKQTPRGPLNTDVIVAAIMMDYARAIPGMKRLADAIRHLPQEQQLFEAWRMMRPPMMRYVEDGMGEQFPKQPANLWADGFGDCKSYTIFISALLAQLGIPHWLRLVRYDRDTWQHIYTVARIGGKRYVLDGCLAAFNREKPYTAKLDMQGQVVSIGNAGLPPMPVAPDVARRVQEINQFRQDLLNRPADFERRAINVRQTLANLTRQESQLMSANYAYQRNRSLEAQAAIDRLMTSGIGCIACKTSIGNTIPSGGGSAGPTGFTGNGTIPTDVTKMNTTDAAKLGAEAAGAAYGLPPGTGSAAVDQAIKTYRLVEGWFPKSIAGTLAPASIEYAAYVLSSLEGPKILKSITTHCANENRPNYSCEIGAIDWMAEKGPGYQRDEFKKWRKEIDAYWQQQGKGSPQAFLDRLRNSRERISFRAAHLIAAALHNPGWALAILNEKNRTEPNKPNALTGAFAWLTANSPDWNQMTDETFQRIQAAQAYAAGYATTGAYFKPSPNTPPAGGAGSGGAGTPPGGAVFNPGQPSGQQQSGGSALGLLGLLGAGLALLR